MQIKVDQLKFVINWRCVEFSSYSTDRSCVHVSTKVC